MLYHVQYTHPAYLQDVRSCPTMNYYALSLPLMLTAHHWSPRVTTLWGMYTGDSDPTTVSHVTTPQGCYSARVIDSRKLPHNTEF